MPRVQLPGLKPTHKLVQAYYGALAQFDQHHVTRETAVRQPFLDLLRAAAGQRGWSLEPEFPMQGNRGNRIVVDAALRDNFWRVHGYWEAKDTDDDLEAEVRRKFSQGYPDSNILFQAPNRALLFQNGQPAFAADLADPRNLVQVVNQFFAYTQPIHQKWDEAVADFQQQVPDLGRGLKQIIDAERKANPAFVAAFNDFAVLCRASLNPNLRDEAVEEMLIQHLLTERLFRTVFKNPDFIRRNAIARQIETVLDALFSRSYSRDEYLGSLERFYRAIEDTAATITDFSTKQKFLNTVYEKFFQGFCVKVADTHGIVYTPPPIVRFMVASVEWLLKEHFGKSLASPNVHILDPFGGTGNFTVHTVQAIPKTALPHKFAHELWVNEIMLLPYYVCCMNIEHAFFEATGQYQPFPGACLVDTFETAEKTQHEFGFMSAENTERVKRQKKAPIFVVISNPPYNAWQANENDNNKNRKYGEVDRWVADTYAADSKASNKNSLSDPYVKAIRWASERIGDEGVVAFVTNNGFIDGIACDGMRKHLAQGFDEIYTLDLTGNVRKNPKLSGTTHNVFGIQVGVSINFFVRKKGGQRPGRIFYARTDEFLRKEQKFHFLETHENLSKIEWKQVKPDKGFNWLTEGMSEDFPSFLPLGSKGGDPETVFTLFSNGVKTNRDAWAINFRRDAVATNMQRMVDAYNETLLRWQARTNKEIKADDFVNYEESRISWSRDLKLDLRRGNKAEFLETKIKPCLYRPFARAYLFFDRQMNEEIYSLPKVFPFGSGDGQNVVIAAAGLGNRQAFGCLVSDRIPALDLAFEKAQCFPFYTYAEGGSGRQENITDWALEQFRRRYPPAPGAAPLTKWDIFYYVYAILHHPQYRERYAANLRRELPRIPFVAAEVTRLTSKAAKEDGASSRRLLQDAEVFHAFAAAGKQLADLHIGYEQAKEYPFTRRENPSAQLNWRVEKMKLIKVGTRSTASHSPSDPKAGAPTEPAPTASIVYNDFLTLEGIPPETFEYRLGNRSALDWAIDQYQVSTDKRSGITNDPNRPDDPQYIVRLIAQVITVSLETMKIVKSLPALKEG
jgi:predicted helicase